MLVTLPLANAPANRVLWVPAKALTIGMVALACAFGCRPKSLASEAPPAVKSDEPWVAEYLGLVEFGCECESSDCVETTKSKLDARLAEQGGLDEVPAEVHEGHGKFEKCYRDGTHDPMRDHQRVADDMCGCTTEGCVKDAMIRRVHLDDKYRDLTDASIRASIDENDKRFATCRDERTLNALKIAEHYEKTAMAVCTCAQKTGCIGDRLHELGEVPAAPLIVGYPAVKDRIDKAHEQICACAIGGSIGTKVGGIQLTTKNCKALEEAVNK